MLHRVSCLLPVLLAACSSSYMPPAQKLEMAVFRYNDAIRWRNFEAASEFIPAAKRKAWLELRREVGEDLTVLDVEVGTVRQVEENKRAEVNVEFTWNRMPSNLVEKTTFKQEWEYGDDRTWWFVKQEEVKPAKPKAVKPEDRF